MSLIDLKLVLLVLVFTCHRADVCRVEHCTDPTRCVLSEDQKSCKCNAGFYSEKCDKSAQIKVMCGNDYMAIRATEEFFSYHKVPLESLHLPNKLCRAEREVIDGVAYYMFRVSKEKYLSCGGKSLKKNSTHFLYSLSVTSETEVTGNIIRDSFIKMDFTCIYPYVRTVSLAFPVFPVSSEMMMHVDEMEATIQMMLYLDHSFTEAYTTTPTIELRDKVYVQVSVTEPEDYFLVQVDECWATQSPQPNSTEGLVHSLIHNGCADDHTVSFLSTSEGEPGRNGQSPTVRYSFDMFRFTSEPHELYLHCTVQLCELDDLKSCTPNCNSISKREAVEAGPSQGLLSYGPIRIEMPDRPQTSILTTVVLPVAGVWTLGLFLSILIAVAKAGSRRIAETEEH
ncbi:zona pellucida glycoprotein d isoform X2 [Melanotaenia boesemani]|uniref:zona pellucida glycoprotein d isoform X2 n=1 Tax=Melanotaenia boesemani TaxID=1250792 RepID=UPI001C054162|nr:zona pellucida glycoprotein d isoform X2 [Melanotaenia boesemani]